MCDSSLCFVRAHVDHLADLVENEDGRRDRHEEHQVWKLRIFRSSLLNKLLWIDDEFPVNITRNFETHSNSLEHKKQLWSISSKKEIFAGLFELV